MNTDFNYNAMLKQYILPSKEMLNKGSSNLKVEMI